MMFSPQKGQVNLDHQLDLVPFYRFEPADSTIKRKGVRFKKRGQVDLNFLFKST
jgi:hypothetical protein